MIKPTLQMGKYIMATLRNPRALSNERIAVYLQIQRYSHFAHFTGAVVLYMVPLVHEQGLTVPQLFTHPNQLNRQLSAKGSRYVNCTAVSESATRTAAETPEFKMARSNSSLARAISDL